MSILNWEQSKIKFPSEVQYLGLSKSLPVLIFTHVLMGVPSEQLTESSELTYPVISNLSNRLLKNTEASEKFKA